MKVLVTGANGFVGKALCKSLQKKRYDVVAAFREASKVPVLLTRDASHHFTPIFVNEINGQTDWTFIDDFKVDVVIHLAARVHIMNDVSHDPLVEYRAVNVEGTKQLAQAAAKAGVKRFIFLSSIKVNGENTLDGQKYQEVDQPNPLDPYGISKWEAEVALKQVGQETGMEIVIIRTVLVYGPGVRANFLNLISLVDKRLPLPFSKKTNQRSIVYIENLVSALIAVLSHPKAANQLFLVSDGQSLSTAEVVELIAIGLGKEARLTPFLANFCQRLLLLMGKKGLVNRLFGSLVVDSSYIQKQLNWRQPFTTEEGILQTTKWYQSRKIL